jgi:predicted TIM-barrel fold metal-dependent hydrolase
MVSRPEDFIIAATRYPEAMLQYAHTGGGPDWEYACKALRSFPNVYLDVSGSNNENNMVEFAVKTLGVERVLFGSDNMYYQSVGKIMDARLTEEDKRKIFFDNYNNILKKGGHHVD